jgi:hypothetical protein
MKAKMWFVWCVALLLFVLTAGIGRPETLRWENPTTGIDNTGATAPLTVAEQAALTNYLRYKVGTGAWTYFTETRDGKTSWTGTLPAAVGVAADYTVSAALRGADGVERDSAMSAPVSYTVPFPPGPTPGSPVGPTISRP